MAVAAQTESRASPEEIAELVAAADKIEAERQARAHLYATDFPAFAQDNLVIRPREGADTLFRLNTVQRIVHERAEAQKARTGRVRMIVLKPRQPGISTYVEGRFYWLVRQHKGLRAFILTHQDDATSNLYEMAQRFWVNDPHRPVRDRASAKEMRFAELDSSYRVGTAGSKGVGRSQTIQLFHGSEVAFWPNAEEHAAGVLRAIHDVPGTEVWLESTANGVGGLFYSMTIAAQRGANEYELCFIPWFDHDEYVAEPPEGWRPPEAMKDTQHQWGLTLRQMRWAYETNASLASADGLSPEEWCWRFKQEYPSTVEEAFRSSREGSLISAELVAKARGWLAGPQVPETPTVLGIDLACGGDGEGGDMSVIIDRYGRRLGGKIYKRWREKNTLIAVTHVIDAITRTDPDQVFIDTGGGGAQVYDILVARGFGPILTLVNFGQRADDPRRFANKRAEMWGLLRDWLVDTGGAQIPDDDVLDAEMTSAIGHEDLNQRLKLEPKTKIRQELGYSPDGADAAALTFASPVRKRTRPLVALRSIGPAIADSVAGY